MDPNLIVLYTLTGLLLLAVVLCFLKAFNLDAALHDLTETVSAETRHVESLVDARIQLLQNNKRKPRKHHHIIVPPLRL